jgi:hypothetical protein
VRLIATQERPGQTIETVDANKTVRLVSYGNDADFAELGWLERLMPGRRLQVVCDSSQTEVFPNSIVCARPNNLKPELLRTIAKTPGVILYHVSDEWYLDPLDNYHYFTHVIRNYYHTGLNGSGISHFPLGPCHFSQQPVFSRPAAERKYVWSFAGQLASTRRSLVKCLRDIIPNRLHVTGGVRRPQRPISPNEYLDLLGNSIFVPCGMGNVNLESFRIYEALECGAIPIVEKRPWLDYFNLLFGPHPLPSVNRWGDAPALMRRLQSEPRRLNQKQSEIRTWWENLQKRLSQRLTQLLNSVSTQPRCTSTALAFPGRLRGAFEMLKHHDVVAIRARALLSLKRAVRWNGSTPRTS